MLEESEGGVDGESLRVRVVGVDARELEVGELWSPGRLLGDGVQDVGWLSCECERLQRCE